MPLDHRPIAFPRLDAEQIASLRRFASSARFERARENPVALHGPREFTGDADKLTGRPALASAVARSACETLRIGVADLRRVVGELPRVGDVR
jgi:thioredoxin reductase (NADPH)